MFDQQISVEASLLTLWQRLILEEKLFLVTLRIWLLDVWAEHIVLLTKINPLPAQVDLFWLKTQKIIGYLRFFVLLWVHWTNYIKIQAWKFFCNVYNPTKFEVIY